MKKLITMALLSAALLSPLRLWAAESSTRRFGLFVGANNGGEGRAALRYAVSDARTVSRVFKEMGGIDGEDNVLLIDPTLAEIHARLDALQAEAANAKESFARTEAVFYYSGHADEEGLLLGEERLGYGELRERVNNIPSDMRIVILDSCSSGAFTRAKGGVKTRPFMADSSASAEGYAFLTSSSATEVSQESDVIKGSYFTHSLVAGLRGAADTLGDGKVSLNEVYRFAYEDTLAKTETSLYGAQHPSYDMQISGTGDVILTDIREISASLTIDLAIQGRLSIRDKDDHLIAELSKSGVKPMELGLPPGVYRVILQEGSSFFRAETNVQRLRQNRLRREQFREFSPQAAVPRGSTQMPNAEPEASGRTSAPREDPDVANVLERARALQNRDNR